MNSKERCLAALHGHPVDRVPVFPLLMSFSATRLGITYRDFATNGHAMAEAQLKTRQVFGVDAITACSDAFRVSADLGGEMVYPESTPPYLARPLVRSEEDLKSLSKPDASRSGSRMADRTRGTREMVKTAGNDCLVLGWVDMPFAEACSVCGVTEFLTLLHDQPTLAHHILEFLTDIVIDFCLMQLETSAPMIGAGDAAASLISPKMYREFALPYEQRVCEAVHAANGTVKLHICGNTSRLLHDMIGSGADLFNVDHLVDFPLALEVYGGVARCFKGNLNPVTDLLQATPEQCEQMAWERLRMATGKAYMLSGGCEVPAAVTDDVFRAFCQAPRTLQHQAQTG
jgi:uroporphyrinogen decarboxylase